MVESECPLNAITGGLPAAEQAASVIDKHIQARPAIAKSPDESADLLLLGQIGGDEIDRSAIRHSAHRCYRRLTADGVAAHDGYIGATPNQFSGGDKADSGSTSGNETDFAGHRRGRRHRRSAKSRGGRRGMGLLPLSAKPVSAATPAWGEAAGGRRPRALPGGVAASG